MYFLSVKSSFDAAHFLRAYKGKCAGLHGHTFEVESIFKVKKLDSVGIGFDFSKLKEILSDILEDFDHKNLNDIKPFDKINPTCENLAYEIFKRLKKKVSFLAEVKVSESPRAWAAYREVKS